MSVYTTVLYEEMQRWLQQYEVGQLTELRGISAGITNTNYFVTTTDGHYVLTLFEVLTLDEAACYLNLMSHLVHHGIACPAPLANDKQVFVSMLAGKPACLVTYLAGQDVAYPSAAQCHATGQMLARMHDVGQHFKFSMPNPRGAHWWNQIAPRLYTDLTADAADLLRQEIIFQNQQTLSYLPTGVIHADLFRDNVLIHSDIMISFIDFYYACNDILIYDVAIAVNDWARLGNNTLNDALAQAFLQGYQSIRPFSPAEQAAWPAMLRAAALRFWVSRLWDYYHPTNRELGSTKDPRIFQTVLLGHRARKTFWL